MPTVKLNTWRFTKVTPYGMCVCEKDWDEQTPYKEVEIKTLADIETALMDFAEEMRATGKPWRVTAYFVPRSGRKPAGFDKAKASGKLSVYVNRHLVEQEEA
jgi:hypothetical protein